MPDKWVDYLEPTDNWTDYNEPEPEKSYLQQFDESWVNKPLVKTGWENTAEKYDPVGGRRESDWKIPEAVPMIGGGTWRSLGAGLMEGRDRFVEEMTTPLNLASTIASGGAAGSTRVGAARAFGMAEKALAAPQMAAGGARTYEGVREGDYGKAAMGVAEFAGGAAEGLDPLRPRVAKTPRVEDSPYFTGDIPAGAKNVTPPRVPYSRRIEPPTTDWPDQIPYTPDDPAAHQAWWDNMDRGNAGPRSAEAQAATSGTPDIEGPMGADEVPIGDTFDVPEAEVTNDFIAQWKEAGYEIAGQLPGGRTLFKLFKDETGAIPSAEEIKNTLRQMLGRDPSPEEVLAAQSRQPTEGEQTGRVAQFPGPLADVAHEIASINAHDPESPNALKKISEFLDRVEKLKDPSELQRLRAQLREAAVAGQNAGSNPVRVGTLNDLAGVVDRKINQLFPPAPNPANALPVRRPGYDGAAEWPPKSGNVANQVFQPTEVYEQPNLPMGPSGVHVNTRLNAIADAVPEQVDLGPTQEPLPLSHDIGGPKKHGPGAMVPDEYGDMSPEDIQRMLDESAALDDAADMQRQPDVELLDPEAEGVRNNASGESSASWEAMKRQRDMAARGEQFVHVDRAGNITPLITTDAVDVPPPPGSTKGIVRRDGTFQLLDGQGRPPKPEEVQRIAGSMPKTGEILPPEPPPQRNEIFTPFPPVRGDLQTAGPALDQSTYGPKGQNFLQRYPQDLTGKAPAAVTDLDSFLKSLDWEKETDATPGMNPNEVANIVGDVTGRRADLYGPSGQQLNVRNEKNITPGDYPDEPEFMAKDPKTGKAIMSVNVAHSAAELTTGYSKPLPHVMAREGLQNALDAVKDMGMNGEISIVISENAYKSPGHIEIADNGTGMSRDELFTVYTNLHESGKTSDATATGGKGVGKATYMLGGAHFEVETVKQTPKGKIKSSFNGTPAQIMAGFDIKSVKVPDSTPTGTKFKTTLRDDQDAYYAKDALENIIKYSRNRPGKLSANKSRYDQGATDHDLMGNPNDKKVATDVDIYRGNSRADIYVPESAKIGPAGSTNIHVLNNGMWQFKANMYLAGGVTNGVPDNVVVDLKPNKPELDPDYPFPVQRESLKDKIWEAVQQAVNQHVVEPMAQGKKKDLVKLWGQMNVIPAGFAGNKREVTFFDPGDRLTAAELQEVTTSFTTINTQRVIDRFLDDVLINIGDQKSIDKLVRTGLFMSERYMYGVHVPNPGAPKLESAILINMWAAILDYPNDPTGAARFMRDIIFHEAAHVKSQAGPNDKLQLSPADLADPRLGEYLSGYLNEVAEQGGVDMAHGADFIRRLGEVYGKAGVAQSSQHVTILETIFRGNTGTVGGYGPEIPRLLQLYQESRGRDATSEDILSPTGVKSSGKRSPRKGSVPSDNEAVGAGTPARSAIEIFSRQLPIVADYASTRFILPDGTRVGFKERFGFHETESRRVGVPLYEALESGIVRMRGNAAEVAAPITASQASHLADSIIDLGNEFVLIDVLKPDLNREHKAFTKGTKGSAIRAWINNLFKDFEEGWNKGEGGGKTGALFGGMPFGKAWSGIKQATGIGSGGAVTQNPNQLNWLKEMLAVPSGLTTTLDLSAPGRQGMSLINTPHFWKAAYKMFGGISPKGFDQIDASLRSKPVMQPRRNTRTGKVLPSIAEEAGLKMFEPASKAPMNKRAQATASRWIETGEILGPERIKGVRNPLNALWKHSVGVPIRMSNRAYITFLNHLKVNRFEYLMDRTRNMAIQGITTGKMPMPGIMGGWQFQGGGNIGFKKSVTPIEAMEVNAYKNKILAKEIADFVNTATGQGPLKSHVIPTKQAEVSLETAAGILNNTMFSPGLFASRFRMLNPSTYIMASPMVRKQYLKAAIGTALGWMAMLEMIKMAGGNEVEVNNENVTSADFGKAKIGDTRLDPGGGHQQFLVAFFRMINGGTTSSASNEWHEFGEGYNAETQWSNLERFASNKLNPATKFAYDLLSQSEYKPFHVYDRIAQLFVPLIVQDIISIAKEDPDMLPAIGPAMFGMGTQTYGRGESVGKLVDPEDDWLATGGGLIDLGGREEQEY